MKEYTAAEITKWVLKELERRGWKAWRQNNLRVPGRAFIGQPGLSDVCAFNLNTGCAGFVEVKKIGDTLKKDQIEFLTLAKKAGCFTLIATQDKETGQMVLKEFEMD